MSKRKRVKEEKGTAVYFELQPADRPIGRNEKEDMIKITTEDWTCYWRWNGVLKHLFVPRGTIYDGASIDRWAWTIAGIRPDGLIRAASLAHDIPYRTRGFTIEEKFHGATLLDVYGDPVTCTREEADWVFYAFMEFAKKAKRKCWLAHRAVRIGGSRHWGGPMPSLA